MQILLLEDVKGLGRRGEVKNASNGYARNYLIPKGLAKAATRKESQSVEKQTQEKSAKDTELRKTLEDLRKRTEENPVPVLYRISHSFHDGIFTARKRNPAGVIPHLVGKCPYRIQHGRAILLSVLG